MCVGTVMLYTPAGTVMLCTTADQYSVALCANAVLCWYKYWVLCTLIVTVVFYS